MPLRTRVFLFSFIPFALLLSGSFWAIQILVQKTVREGLRSSLRENHQSVSRLRSRSDLQNSRFLRVAGENAALKAGIQLLLSAPGSVPARLTVEDQLQELCARMGFDFLMVSDSAGTPLAGARAEGVPQSSFLTSLTRLPPRGLVILDGNVYQVASMPVDQGEDSIAQLFVGERFDFSEFGTPTVLIHNGRVIRSSVPNVSVGDMEKALSGCKTGRECEVRLANVSYLSLPMESPDLGREFTLRSFQNADAASRPVQAALTRVFLFISAASLVAVLLFSVISSHSVVQPLGLMIAHLRRTASTGELTEFPEAHEHSGIREIQELTGGFNRAATSVRDAQNTLRRANVEFVGSLASALDARDRYTAGHSHRVSDLACATAEVMGVTAVEKERIRIGALLHDIGKIGIADALLQKPGRLTREEFTIVQRHTVIGKRILEGVKGFTPYLSSVELHHENWDGTGYPHGQRGEETPLCARIIHVVDAYDAMTTARPYRGGISHAHAVEILLRYSRRQFDAAVVKAFVGLPLFDADIEYASVREEEVLEIA